MSTGNSVGSGVAPALLQKVAGSKETYPTMLVAIPVGMVAGLATLLVYRYWMGSSRPSEQKRVEVERKLDEVIISFQTGSWCIFRIISNPFSFVPIYISARHFKL
jgi:hypothetical protein